jgi:hypothetical protein
MVKDITDYKFTTKDGYLGSIHNEGRPHQTVSLPSKRLQHTGPLKLPFFVLA